MKDKYGVKLEEGNRVVVSAEDIEYTKPCVIYLGDWDE